MDDDSKQILILKIVVASLVALAILVFIIIILVIKNGNKKPEEMDVTTRRTLSEEVSEEVSSTSEFTTGSNTTEATTTETTTSTTTTTTTTTKKNSDGTKTTKKTQSSGGGSSSNIPTYTYTVIGQNDASSYSNADNNMEWQLVNKINSNRSNKYKVAAELRTAAERIADVCCEAPGTCKSATKELVDNEYQLTYRVYYDETGRYNLDYFYNNLVNNTILDNKYSYLGVGVYRRSSSLTCTAWIIDYD
ncbi:MAG: hypothetical protein IJS56_06790 [Bacilli bacterium]|nr:hypothetical protein [Bacilli bacterium]